VSTALKAILIAVASGVPSVLLILFAQRFWVRKQLAGAGAEIDTLTQEQAVLKRSVANSFGLASGGMRQVRGSGVLALTERELIFVMAIPRRTTRIERSRIRGIEQTTSHLGKTRGRPLLRIRFRGTNGTEDSIAWLVQNLGEWTTALGGGSSRRS
jgi:hypothetical protein